jgi:hypothetical protein
MKTLICMCLLASGCAVNPAFRARIEALEAREQQIHEETIRAEAAAREMTIQCRELAK